MTENKTNFKLFEVLVKRLVKGQLEDEFFKQIKAETKEIPKEVPKEIPDDFITQDELMRRLKVSGTTLFRYRKKGMPFIKNGKKVYYQFDKVLKYLNHGR